MEKLKKGLAIITMASFIIAMVLTATSFVSAQSQSADSLLWGNTQGEVGNQLGLGNEDPRIIVAALINVILGFLGIIAVVIILMGGFKWMTAGGNEDKIEEAKKLMSAGVVGLIIILASWGLATFVVGLLYNATTT